MTASTTTSSLLWMQMLLLEDPTGATELPADPPSAEEIVCTMHIEVPGHPMFEIFVPVERPAEILRARLPQWLSTATFDPSGYAFDHLQRWAEPSFFPLDNRPTDDPATHKTSLREARAAQMGFWEQAKFVSLDAFSLAEATDFREEVEGPDGIWLSLLEMLKARYQPFYQTVVILLTDIIQFGDEDHFLVLKTGHDFQSISLTALRADRAFSLARKEAILTACVPAEAVILRDDFIRPLPQLAPVAPIGLPEQPAAALTFDTASYYEVDPPGYTLRLNDWAKSGLSREDFIKQKGLDAFAPVVGALV